MRTMRMSSKKIDETRDKAEQELKKLERKIRKAYKDSYKEISKEWDEYMEKADKRLENAQKEYNSIKKNGTAEEIAKAKQKLQKIKQNKILRDKEYREVLNKTTDKIAKANQTALDYANNIIPSMYAIGYSNPSEVYSVPKDIEKAMKSAFDIRDEHTIKRRIQEGDIELPNKKKRLKIPKDKRWNSKKINSSILQGILKGESAKEIAKRLEPIVDNNKNAAIRNARTLMTGAENQGRLDRYRDLEKQGAVLKKVWIATGDGRTRDWHVEMDEQEVDIDKEFIDGLGNELMYPGDPGGAPETVYNCRCSMQSHVVGFRKSDGRIRYINHDRSNDNLQHRQEIQREKERRAKH